MNLPVGAKYWQNVALGASLNGPAMRCPYNGHLWADFAWTGTPTGTFALQTRTAGGPWITVPRAAAGFPSQPAGAPGGPILGNWVNLPGDEFRFTYAGTAGTTVTANVGFGDVQEY